MKKLIPFLFLTSLFISFNTNSYAAVQYGYVSRPCGFDMDNDGRVGENGTQKFCQGGSRSNEQCTVDSECPSSTCANTNSTTNQDCNVCDGATTDPDGDSDTEDQVYVDCNSGVNAANCGTPGSPCLSISYALSNTATSTNTNNRVDGTGDGAEDIICVRSTCAAYNGSLSGSMNITNSGVAGTRTETAVWPEKISYQYANDPFMITAWDTDNDGAYPPYDTNQPEPFIIDGCQNSGQFETCTSASLNILFTIGGADRIEIAHGTIRNIGVVAPGTASETGRYVMTWDGTSTPSHHRIHDLELYRNLRNTEAFSNHRLFGFNIGNSGSMQYVAIENVYMDGNAGWHFRGWQGTNTVRGLATRMKSFTIKNQQSWVGNNGGLDIVPIRTWSKENEEIIGAFFDGTGATISDPVNAIDSDLNATNTFIVGNKLLNYDRPIVVKPRGGGGSNAQGHLGATIEANWIDWTEYRNESVVGISIHSPATNGEERTECTSDGDGNPCTPSSNDACVGGIDGNEDCDCSLNPKLFTDVDVVNNVVDGRGNDFIRAGVVVKWGDNCDDFADADSGPFTIRNNTIMFDSSTAYSDTNPRAAIMIGRSPINDWDHKYVKGPVNVFNNLVYGLENDVAIMNHKRGSNNAAVITGGTHYTGANFNANNNIYLATTCSTNTDCDGGTCSSGRCNIIFRQATSTWSTLANWQSNSGEEANSYTATSSPSCVPTLEVDGIHIADGSCAEDNGNNTNCPSIDFEGDVRGDGNCDIGADEIGSAAPTTTPGAISLSAAEYAATEDVDSTITITVTRTEGSDGAVSVDYGTVSSSAVGGATCTGTEDYITTSGTLNWSNGDSTDKTFDITICGNNSPENTEIATIQLSNVTVATPGLHQWASLVITDNDAPVGQAPSVNTVDGVKTACTTTSGTTISIPNVVVTGGPSYPNRVLIAVTGAESAYNAADPPVTGCNMNTGTITWGAQNLTRVVSRAGHSGTVSSVCSSIFYLLNPSPGSATLTATFPSTFTSAELGTFNIYNATQSEPTAKTTAGFANTVLFESTDIQTLVPDSLVIDALALQDRVAGGNAIPGVGQIERVDRSCAEFGSQLLSSTKDVPTPSTATILWSWATGAPGAVAHSILAWPSTSQNVTTTTTSGSTTTTDTTTTTVVNAPTLGYACIHYCEEN